MLYRRLRWFASPPSLAKNLQKRKRGILAGLLESRQTNSFLCAGKKSVWAAQIRSTSRVFFLARVGGPVRLQLTGSHKWMGPRTCLKGIEQRDAVKRLSVAVRGICLFFLPIPVARLHLQPASNFRLRGDWSATMRVSIIPTRRCEGSEFPASGVVSLFSLDGIRLSGRSQLENYT